MIHRSAATGQNLLFLICCLIPVGAGMAQGVTLYRCEIDGAIEFRQTACVEGEETLQHVEERSSGMTPSEPGVRLKKPSEKTDTVTRKRHRASNDQACWRKRQRLEGVERRLRAGYKASEYQRLHDRQREYEAYIRQFCP